MPRYRVVRKEYWNVTDTYTVEVDATDEDQAEQLADGMFSTGSVDRSTHEELEDSEVKVEELADEPLG